MILDKKILSELLGRAMSSGADFAEVFAEHTRHGLVVLSGGAKAQCLCLNFGHES